MRKFITNEKYAPKRATKGSAGYDFLANENIIIKPKETITIDTNIKVEMEDDDVLLIMPRSGLGFKYNLTLDNTVGVIDSDFKDNIKLKMTNNSDKQITIEKGKGYAQGIFVKFLKTCDDDETSMTVRNDGFGNTDEEKENHFKQALNILFNKNATIACNDEDIIAIDDLMNIPFTKNVQFSINKTLLIKLQQENANGKDLFDVIDSLLSDAENYLAYLKRNGVLISDEYRWINITLMLRVILNNIALNDMKITNNTVNQIKETVNAFNKPEDLANTFFR